ncbi:hypothetical protein DFJ74DRAFT_765412 [Hyaloraphidium curvatum]|nr:hypothetical protein DFJ74DRAFT_765412 [Hyaloraphidium curvatum]
MRGELANFDGGDAGRQPPLPDLSRAARPPAAGSAKEAAVGAAISATAPHPPCTLATDCPSGCCLFGRCLPDEACRSALAPLAAVRGAAHNASCGDSTYRECSSGCCVAGRCAPHGDCWGALRSNHLARCEVSTFTECDSGCCFEGRCHHSDQCFPRGQGAPPGSVCTPSNATECASRCCSPAGQCAATSTCWPGLDLEPLRPAAPFPARQAAGCPGDRACRTEGGDPCPCDHVCLCGKCLPENSEAARRLGPALSNASLCGGYDRAVSAMHNAIPPDIEAARISMLFAQQDELREKAVK